MTPREVKTCNRGEVILLRPAQHGRTLLTVWDDDAGIMSVKLSGEGVVDLITALGDVATASMLMEVDRRIKEEDMAGLYGDDEYEGLWEGKGSTYGLRGDVTDVLEKNRNKEEDN